MRRFVVPADAFFDTTGPLAERAFSRYSAPEIRARCGPPMQQLIARFELAGRTVFSIGSNGGHEEYWLHRAGCRMTFIDLDETGTLEPYLASLPQAAEGAEGTLVYYIGDASDYVREDGERFECCYVSSFPPDEFRRQAIQTTYRPWYHIPLYGKVPPARRAIVAFNGVVRRVTGNRPIRVKTWPPAAPTFDETLSAAVDRKLAPGGIFVNQSYAGGVDIPDNPHFVDQMRAELRALGAELIALYHFAPGLTSVSLAVAYKGSPDEAAHFCARIAAHPDIEDFHGRSDYGPRTISRVELGESADG